MKKTFGLFGAGTLVVTTVLACGSSNSSLFDASDGGGSGSSSGSSGDQPPPGFGDADIEASSSSGGDSGLNACASDKAIAKLAPLDLMLMQDTSGSMWEYVSGTTSKYDAVKAALDTFMTDPASAGIGLGLQFFPLFGAVPNNCTAYSECGAAAPCVYKACNNTRTATVCQSDADCRNVAGACTLLSRCHNEQELFCLTDADCGATYGPCDRPVVAGECYGEQISCTTADYAAPASAIAPLPGAGAAIDAALAAHVPNGQTPTYNALQGAIQAAQTYATAHPGEVVAVVLSTDGIPYTQGKCDDTVADIEAIAAAGLAGTPSIKTFVIGVLSPTDNTADATTTLNGIAAAGGTTAATILGTSTTTEADFISALQNIRGQSLPCQFHLPVPEAGTPDYGKVNVVYTSSTTKADTVIGYAESAGGCDPKNGGWYYDIDPSEGGTPSNVILCPSSCSQVQSDPQGQVSVVQGCKTSVIVPSVPH